MRQPSVDLPFDAIGFDGVEVAKLKEVVNRIFEFIDQVVDFVVIDRNVAQE